GHDGRVYQLLPAEPPENEGDRALPPRGRYQQLNDVSFPAARSIASAPDGLVADAVEVAVGAHEQVPFADRGGGQDGFGQVVGGGHREPGAARQDEGLAGLAGGVEASADEQGRGGKGAGEPAAPELLAGGGAQAGEDAVVGEDVEAPGPVQGRGDVGDAG